MTAVLPEFVDFAHELAHAAGSVVRTLFRMKVEVDEKEDQSPVTLADRKAERIMHEMILKHYPDHGILGEELGSYKPEAKYIWVLDPVDGTKSFISGIPTFGTLIALTRLGVPVLGVIDQPILCERWIGAAGMPSTFNELPVRARSCPDLKLATLSTTSPHLFSGADKPKYRRVEQAARYAIYGHDCYAYAQLASGFIDLVVESGLKRHDFCALRPVIESAGGVITDWEGRPLTMASDGRVIAAGDARLHAQALEMLRG